jgi:hypothetical protein
MKEAGFNDSASTIIAFPIQAEQRKSDAPVLWGDSPELVLERLRRIAGRRAWWQ